VKLPHAYKLRTLVKLTGISLDDLQLLNPELRHDDIRSHTTLPRGYEIYMPPPMAENLQSLWSARQTRRPSKKNLTSRLPEEPAG